VVFSDTCDADVGAARWDVYAGTAPGFAPAPTPFGLPASRCRVPFDAPARLAPTSVRYDLTALDCDARVALTVYSDACDATVGATRWDVYRTQTTGFAAVPARLAVPTARCGTPFAAPAMTTPAGQVASGLANLRGDRRPELVVVADTCASDVGRTHWDVYVLR
jgi:hypothetical protein